MGRRIVGIALVVALFGAAIVVYFKWGRPTWTVEGSVDTDQVWLICTKCDAETAFSVNKFVKVPRNEAGNTFECPKCGAMAAVVAQARCGKCGRLLIPQGANAAFVCPHCKAPLGPPRPEPTSDSKAPSAGSDKP